MTKQSKKKTAKDEFREELKGLISQKLSEINHYVAGCDSPFSYSQISDVQESLCEIEVTLGIRQED